MVPMRPTLGECLKEDCHPKATSSDFYQKAGRNFTKRNLWLYSLILKCNFFYVYTCLCSSVWVVMSLQIRGPRVLFLGCCLLCFVFAVGYLTCFGTQQSVQLAPGICPSLPSWHCNCDHAWLFHIGSGFKLVFLYSNMALSKQPPQPSILLFFFLTRA